MASPKPPASKKTQEMTRGRWAPACAPRRRGGGDADGESARLLHDLEVHQIELEMQNQELRAAHAQLEESRARLADLYDFAPVVYVTLDAEGRIVEANLTAASYFGVERGNLVGQVPGRPRDGGRPARAARAHPALLRRAHPRRERAVVLGARAGRR